MGAKHPYNINIKMLYDSGEYRCLSLIEDKDLKNK